MRKNRERHRHGEGETSGCGECLCSGSGKVPHALAYFIQPYQVLLARMRSPSQFAICARCHSGFCSAGDGAKCQERSRLDPI